MFTIDTTKTYPNTILLHMETDCDLHQWLKETAIRRDMSVAELCKQMVRHCATELGFEDD